MVTSQCEMYDINRKSWIRIADLNIPCYDHCICNFNDTYLYKFGGLDENNKMCQVLLVNFRKQNAMIQTKIDGEFSR